MDTDAIAAPAHDPATTWRALSGPFTCTGCGTRVLYDSGGPMQTLDGSRKLCRTCNGDRIDAHWDNLPAGIYAIHVRDATTDTILATSFVRHEPVAPHDSQDEPWRPRGAERCSVCGRRPGAPIHTKRKEGQ